jgi:hypothetical protein
MIEALLRCIRERREGRRGTVVVAAEGGGVRVLLVALFIRSLYRSESRMSAEGKVIEMGERLWAVKANI